MADKLLESLLADLRRVLEMIGWLKVQPYVEPSAARIVSRTKVYLGKDASPRNLAPQELSCAEGVSNILHQVFPDFPAGVVSTAELDGYLTRSPHFKPTKIPKAGSVIISPRTTTRAGHVGIFLTSDRIASNDSKTGLFQDNYSIPSWAKEMRDRRGLRIFFYEPI